MIGGEKLLSFTVLTCPAGDATQHLHQRSPVVLVESDWDTWLAAGQDCEKLMPPAPDDRVEICEVGHEVGNVRNNQRRLVEPVASGGE